MIFFFINFVKSHLFADLLTFVAYKIQFIEILLLEQLVYEMVILIKKNIGGIWWALYYYKWCCVIESERA